MPGMFIDVEVDDDDPRRRRSRAEARGRLPRGHLRERATGSVEIVEENLDECVLCELCLAGRARRARCASMKLYDGTALERSS